MIWLILAIIALAASAWLLRKKQREFSVYARLVFFVALALWIWSEVGGQAFRGAETSLLGWFILGLLMFLVAEALLFMGVEMAGWAPVATAVASLGFAMGYDILRPDSYSVIPAVLVAAMVISVAFRAYVQFAAGVGKDRQARLMLVLYIAAMTVLVFAGVYKIVDRGWAFQWAFLAGGGALLFAGGQLWLGWERVLHKVGVPAWMQAGAVNLGQLMMVVSAVFVYRDFL